MIYLDHNSTTPIAPEVLEAMRPYLERHFGNPSSAHAHGATAAAAVAMARSEVAALLGGEPDGVVFTASGSEADNLAIAGVALARLGEREHIVTSAVEHPAVLATCRYLQRRLGFRLSIVPVDSGTSARWSNRLSQAVIVVSGSEAACAKSSVAGLRPTIRSSTS